MGGKGFATLLGYELGLIYTCIAEQQGNHLKCSNPWDRLYIYDVTVHMISPQAHGYDTTGIAGNEYCLVLYLYSFVFVAAASSFTHAKQISAKKTQG